MDQCAGGLQPRTSLTLTLSAQVACSPIPVTSTYDFYWWIGFSCKYQMDCLHLFLNRDVVTPELMQSVEHFYCSWEWQQWSFHNHAAKMKAGLVWASFNLDR